MINSGLEIHDQVAYFFIDIHNKGRIVKDPIPYQKALSRSFDNKEIHLIIEQPKRL
jgi:hypothetical protein